VQNPFKSPDEAEPAKTGGIGSEKTIAAPIKKVVTPVAARRKKYRPWRARPAARNILGQQIESDFDVGAVRPRRRQAPRVRCSPNFCLDSVKVVHNDLSGLADVEVVPIKSRTADKTGRAVAAAPEKKPWEYLAERMFHATVD